MNPSSPLIRTFRATDARAALGAVKAAFGADAVILETKQIAGGLFSRPQIEVIAASGSIPHPAPAPARGRSVDRRPYRNLDPDRAAGRGDGDLEADMLALRRVVDELRADLHRPSSTSTSTSTSPEPELGGPARRVLHHLIERGVDDVMARALVDAAEAGGATRPPEMLRAIAARLARQLVAAPCPWSAESRRTIALVGPTGVGKTTAIAKIAARALLETRFKVGLITVDTYRVGASDQLSRYGKIMGLATHVARDKAGLAAAVDRCRDADLLLIDTAGRSDAASLAAQMDLIKTAPQVQLHLVMSAATGARELGAVARRYQGFGVERLIFTKLDEADGPAGALSATAIVPRPISCLCDGQRVPEDIHPVTDDDLFQRFLGIAPALRTTEESLRGPG